MIPEAQDAFRKAGIHVHRYPDGSATVTSNTTGVRLGIIEREGTEFAAYRRLNTLVGQYATEMGAALALVTP